MTGPGLWIRIRHRFGPRLTEWLVATQTFLWGFALLLPSETFSTAPTWDFFEAIAHENVWGWLMLGLGLARLIGLWVNGTRPKVTPWIRVVSAFLGFLVFIGISYGFAASGVVGTWIAIYPAIAICELINMRRAATDVGESYA